MDNINNKEFILAKLDAMLISRKESSPEKSYVASLYKKGNEYINGKVLEETNELIEAVNKKDKNHIIHEAADLWFHSLVSLSFNGISSKDILAELNARFGLSGLEEKKLRNKWGDRMLSGISPWSILLILIIVVVLFGTKKLRNVGSDLGSAIKSFKKSSKEDNDDKSVVRKTSAKEKK